MIRKLSYIILLVWFCCANILAQEHRHQTIREVLECNYRSRQTLPPLKYEFEAEKDFHNAHTRVHATHIALTKSETEGKVFSSQGQISAQIIRNTNNHSTGRRTVDSTAVLVNDEALYIRHTERHIDRYRRNPAGAFSKKALKEFSLEVEEFPHLLGYGAGDLRRFSYLDMLNDESSLFELDSYIDEKHGLVYSISQLRRSGEELQLAGIWVFAEKYGCMMVRSDNLSSRRVIKPQKIPGTDAWTVGESHFIQFQRDTKRDYSTMRGIHFDEPTSLPIRIERVTRVTKLELLSEPELSDPTVFSVEEVLYNSPLYPRTGAALVQLLEN